jgi:hypothetical protein
MDQALHAVMRAAQRYLRRLQGCDVLKRALPLTLGYGVAKAREHILQLMKQGDGALIGSHCSPPSM